MKQSIRIMLAGFILAGVSAAASAQAQAAASREILREFQQAFIDLSTLVRPSVVEISAQVPVTDEERSQMNDLFKFFDAPNGDGEGAPEGSPHDPNNMPENAPQATASGFIYDAQGHIVTNNHVVRGAIRIEVELADGQKLPATVVGQDADADIAVIKIDPSGLDLRPVRLADSDVLQVGQFAVAMGSPNGLTGSFSYGHVTGLGRESLSLPGDDGLRFQHFIQTDAAINLGNSGGPLCDIDGNVIGVNVAIVYRANSIGFAIPANRVREVVPQLIAHGKMIRGWLGVGIQDLQEVAVQEGIELQEFIEANKLPDKDGSYVTKITRDGPAEKGKLLKDDVIREINGKRIEKSTGLIDMVSAIIPGETAQVLVWRRGEPMTLPVVVGEYPGQMGALFGPALLGMHVDTLELNPEFMKEREMKEQPSDFYIAGVVEKGTAQEAGIRRGDLVVEVGYKEVKTLAEFKKALAAEAKPGKALLLKVWTLSDEEPRKVFVKVPEDFKLD